jgi:protein-S-isoprenylcysteine O-methyltransferase Ste14
MKKEQRRAARRKRVLPPTYLLVSIAAMVSLHFLLPGARVIAFPWALLGLLPMTLGVVLNLVADRALKQHRTTVKPFEKSTSLVTHSVYAISRNPMYLGFALILLGIAVFLGTTAPFIAVLAFPLLMEFAFIRGEEPMMEETFGQAWHAYKAKVRRWL